VSKGTEQLLLGALFLLKACSQVLRNRVEMALSLPRACLEAVERLIEGLVEGPEKDTVKPPVPAYFYILRLPSGALYIGATTDLDQRYKDHRAGKACRASKYDPPKGLVYSESFATFSEARRREAQVKRWSRAKKEALVSGDLAKLQELAKS